MMLKCKIENCDNDVIGCDYCFLCTERRIFESLELKQQKMGRESICRQILKNVEDFILYGYAEYESICTLITWNKGSALYDEFGELVKSYDYVEDSDSIEIVLQSNLKPVDMKVAPSLSETFEAHIYLQDYQELIIESSTIFGEETNFDEDEDYYDDDDW